MEVLAILVYFAFGICSILLGDSAINPKVCQEAVVGKSLRQYIKESHVVGQCLQYVKKSTNGVDKNTVAVVCTNSYYEVIDGVPCATGHLHDCIHVSIPVLCPLDMLATVKRINHGGENGLGISANISLCEPEKGIKLAIEMK